MWIGIHSCCSNSCDGSKSSSPLPASAASAAAWEEHPEGRGEDESALHRVASLPKYVISESASSTV